MQQDALAILQVPVASREFVDRQHRIVAGMVGVVRGGPVDHAGALLDRVVIGQRDGLGMGDEKTVKVPCLRRSTVRTRVLAPGRFK